MTLSTSAPIHIGRAILANNVLTVDGLEYEVRDCEQFASFIQTTSAIIATAIATAFGPETGELVFPKGGLGHFQPSEVEPWQQYSSAVLNFGSDSSLVKVIAGWCTLLCVYQEFVPDHGAEAGAIAAAWYISSKAYKAADATPEAVLAWDKYIEWTKTLEATIARLEGPIDDRQSPWAQATTLVLPAPAALGHLTALDLVGVYGGDMTIVNGAARSYIGFEHSLLCANDVGHITPKEGARSDDFRANLIVRGVERGFRVQVRELQGGGEMVVLRLLPLSPPSIMPFVQ